MDELRALHAAAFAAADPAAAVGRVLRARENWIGVDGRGHELGPKNRVSVVALGKAAPGMAREALRILGDRAAGAVVAYPRGLPLDPHGWPASARLFAAGHPLPDAGSLEAGEAALALVANGQQDDVLLALVSGGGSALCEALPPGVGLEPLRELTRALLESGADIKELNTVRRSLSRLKGGGLARAAAPATIITLLLSDVVGDRPEHVASGPTLPYASGASEALAVLARHGLLGLHPAIEAYLLEARREAPGSSLEVTATTRIVASNTMATQAVAAAARERGFATHVESRPLEGEARDAGRRLASELRMRRERLRPDSPPECFVHGGETTVTVRGEGQGGRNQELALAAALALDGCTRVALLAFATDGIDGPTTAAGAVATGDTIARARDLGIDAEAALARNDSGRLFHLLGDLWVSGPTGTNVNDIAIALLFP